MSTEKVTIVLEALMNVSQVESGISRIQKELKGLNIPKDIATNLTDNFSKIGVLLKDYKKQLNSGFNTQKDINNFNTLGKKIDEVFSDITTDIKKINSEEIRLNVDLSAIKNAKADLTKYSKDLENLLTSTFNKINDGLKKKNPNFDLTFLRQGAVSPAIKAIGKELVSAFNTQDIERYRAAYEKLRQTLNNTSASSKTKQNLAQQMGLNANAVNDVDKVEKKIRELLEILRISDDTVNVFNKTKNNLNETNNELNTLLNNAKNNGAEAFSGIEKDVNDARKTMQGLTEDTGEYGESVVKAADEVKALQQSTQYFFSLRNMINLLKQGLRDAFDTIKDLDKAMTETAVVTNFSVGDMWKKLPEYTANANKLGATVQDMYESTTLYYQQGLDTQQSMAIASETMKMARIGGLEAADATDKMTAALRGFNMELNETSAQRVNDVYSNLAAKTASNTEELGTAMQRTASIAASAGMSFEGTAAFLAQAIETTREPAENIGTAMKTIVARFQEMKKNPLEISEVDGEEVSYNKIDTALQSIGVSLKDTNGQFRELDQVFLDISQRWDSLTQTQQRYIATTAAGSRQQSRFIAMMSNYDRTMQLMDYANNSAGASNEQFNKTLDSLEAKLNKLKNAWDRFLMGIMNDSWTKGIVDGATTVLNTVNSLINTLSFGNKGLKSALSLFTAFTGLKVAGRGANMLIGGLGGLVDPASSVREGLRSGALGDQAAKISNPIVKAIYSLIPHIDRSVANSPSKYQNYGDFKGAKQDLASQLFSNKTNLGVELNPNAGKYTLAGVQSVFDKNELNKEQQKALFASFPGLKKSMTTNLASLLKESGAQPEVAKGLIAGFKKGDITSEQVLQQGGLLTNFNKAVQGRAEEGGEEAARAFVRAERKTISEEETQAIVAQGKAEGKTGKDLQSYVTEKLDEKLNARGTIYTKNQATTDALNAERQLTTAEKAANAFGQMGGALTSAGMSLQMFGSQLAVTNPLLGDMVTRIGGLLSTAGSIPNMISSLIAGGPAVWAIAAAVTALGAAFAYVKHQETKIKDNAKKITKTFEEGNKKAQDNIATLDEYRERLAVLSKGVDINGNNVNLSNADYNEYLQIVDSIAEMHPELVKGYNAQGHAIIDNNRALEEGLRLEKERLKILEKDYTSEESLQGLINARNINKDYYAVTKMVVGDENTSKWQEDQGISGATQVITTPLAGATSKIAKELKDSGIDIDTILSGYGITLKQLEDGEERAVNIFVKNQDRIRAQVSEAMSNTADGIKDSVVDSFDTLAEQTGAFNEAIEPVYKNLATNISNSKAFKDVKDEFKTFIMDGLKDIAKQDLSAGEMIEQSNILVAKFANLSKEGSEFSKIMDDVKDAQSEFVDSLDADAYEIKISDIISRLQVLKEEAEGWGTAYGDALAEYYENYMSQIMNYTTSGAALISEALNTATNEIAAAEGALSSFEEATKKDFSTAAESMKGIYDKTTETFTDSYGTEIQKHAEGFGDQTFWAGAKELLGEEQVSKLSEVGGEAAVNNVQKAMDRLKPMLKEGQEGFEAFYDAVVNNDKLKELADKKLINLDENGWIKSIPDDQFAAVAEALGMSEQFLISMLNKARQFSDISFTNVEKAREALAASDNVIKGTSAGSGEQQTIYVKEDTIRQELYDANYHTIEEQNQQLEKLFKEGKISVIPDDPNKWRDATGYSKSFVDSFKDWGVKSTPDLIKNLIKTGEYTKEEIQGIAENAQKLGLLEDYNKDTFDDTYDETVDKLENPQLSAQTSELQHLNTTADAILYNLVNGKVTPEQAAENSESTKTELYGGEGTDTAVEAFGLGREIGEDGQLGNFLSKSEYDEQRKYMVDLANTYDKMAQIYDTYAKNATTDAARKQYQAAANEYKGYADFVKDQLEEGDKAYADHIKENKEKYKQDAKNSRESRINPEEHKEAQTQTTVNEVVNNTVNTTKEVTEKITTFDAEETPAFTKVYNWLQKTGQDFLPIDILFKLVDGASGIIDIFKSDKKEIEKEPINITTTSDLSGVGAVQKALNAVPKNKSVSVSLNDNISGKLSSIGAKISEIARKAANVSLGGGSSATGVNNSIRINRIPTFSSAAKGKGKVGPKNRGGLTLTGEKGFEIAWLPSEGRSTILGVDGPQMVNLPSDAVVYTHEQSLDIVKRKGIPAGSHADVSSSGTVVKRKYPSTSFSYTAQASNTHKSSNKKRNDSIKKAADEVVKTTNQAGKVLVWWENAARRMNKAQLNAEKTQKRLDDLIKTFGVSAKDYLKIGKEYKNNLEKVMSIASEKSARATQELEYTDKGYKPSKTKAQINEQNAAKKKLDAAKAELAKAKKTKGKKDDKKAKNKVDAAQKAYNATVGAKKDAQVNAYAEAIGARQEISYEVTTKKTTGKGKKKKTKETKETKKEKINLAGYIKMVDGVYQIDQNAINNIAKTNKSKAEAIKQAAEKQLNDLLSKQKEADEELLKAQEELAQFYDDAYEAFYNWDKTITELYFLSQELSRLGELGNVYKAATDNAFAKLEAGIGYDEVSNGLENIIDVLPEVQKALELNRDNLLNQIKTNSLNIEAARKNFISVLNGEEATQRYLNAKANGLDSRQAAQDYDIAQITKQFLQSIDMYGTNLDINEVYARFQQAQAGLYGNQWKGDDYEKIKEGLDKIAEAQTEYLNAITSSYESLTELYQLIEEYQSYMSDFEETLINGIEEQTSKQIDKLSKLNSSLTDAAKDLIDEVKRKLDERRKQEDNLKTEQDITQKRQQLAALRADTSGGHQVQIAQLEKEIAEATQNYERTLEDQLLDRLSQQQDLAAKQREREIALLEAQKEMAAATGTNVENINKWLEIIVENPGDQDTYNQIRDAWLANHGYDEAGDLEKQQLEEQFTAEFTKFLSYAATLPKLIETASTAKWDIPESLSEDLPSSVEGIETKLEEIINLLTDAPQGEVKKYTAKELKDMGVDVNTARQISADQGNQFNFKDLIKAGYSYKELRESGVYGVNSFAAQGVSYSDARQAFSAEELSKNDIYKAAATKEINAAKSKSKSTSTPKTSSTATPKLTKYLSSLPQRSLKNSSEVKKLQNGLNQLLDKRILSGFARLTVDGDYGKKTKAAVKILQNKLGVKATGTWGEKTAKAVRKKYSAYASGGLANFTGPAWLDGTPSKPELVLSAADTKNFIALKDILSKAISSSDTLGSSYGDATYEININVDHINSDYDVDRVAERVKKIIVKDSGYRNVTQVRRLR